MAHFQRFMYASCDRIMKSLGFRYWICPSTVVGVDHHVPRINHSLRSLVLVQLLVVACLSLIMIGFGGLFSAARSAVNPYRLTRSIGYEDNNEDVISRSCLSRSQESLLRSAERQIQMPPLLDQEWKRYGELHRHCNFNNVGGMNLGGHANCRYLMILDSQLVGLGNRFMGLASAMVFAMATDRVLLLDNRRKLGDLLCEPFPASSWLLPDDSPCHNLMDKARAVAAYSSAGINIASDIGDQMVKMSLWDEPSDGDMELFHEEMYRSLMNVKWVVWESDLYTIPNLFLVPSFWARMNRLFVDAEHEVFALVSRLILLPANDVWAIVLKEYVGYLASADTRVGIQIRLHGRSDLAAFDEDANTMAMGCLVNSSYLPAVAGEGTPSAAELAMLYGKRIRQKQAEAGVAVLVASLQSRYFLRLKELYSQSVGTTDGRVVRVHAVSELQKQDFSVRQSQLALAEMWLLSSSHRLAISASSTFGYAAQAWGHLRPLILDFASVNSSCCQCRKGYSIDPCSHLPRAPPRFNLTNLAAPHRQWLHVHLRVCQDRPQAAWQLVHASVPVDTASPVFQTS